MKVEYQNDGKIAYFNDIRFTRDNKSGYYLCARRIDGKRPRLHVYVWEFHNGKTPEGYHIHHIDGDKSNNDLSNLAALHGKAHQSYHNKQMLADETRKKKLDEHLEANRPLATAWHQSEAGREFARQNYERTLRKGLARKIKKQCEMCGNDYKTSWSYRNHSRFCSNACKAKYRRESKVDHIEKQCEICGKSFMSSKYESVVTCSIECKGKKLSITKTGKKINRQRNNTRRML